MIVYTIPQYFYRYVPPLKLTDSLVADDPEPNATRVVQDSLDSSFDEDDLQRLDNLMNDQPIPNPFPAVKQHGTKNKTHQIPTPNTMKELNIASALEASASPQNLKTQR